jgi:glycogen operon protein
MGVNFALFSEDATAVELCLFGRQDPTRDAVRISLRETTNQVWHCYLPDVRPGQQYGYRVHGGYDPPNGYRFNAAKLLLDPYARATVGDLTWDDALFGYRIGSPRGDLDPDPTDSAPFMPKCVVVDPTFAWGGDRHPRTPWSRTVIYECHVKGMTALHPDVPPNLRGTYLGLCSDAILDHLLSLGITAVELLPVHHFLDDRHLVERGLRNYWGYNTIGFFAPDARYATAQGLGSPVDEFKTMVRTLHSAGLEVILDVVYNHTGEGNHLGPTLSFRGIDNTAYYRPVPDDPRYYYDFTGTGNSLNVRHPRTLQLIMDSLRYWVTEMHVDGFRFDLAPVLARELFEVDRLSAFFDIIQQDPTLQSVKLIAEPWDVGPGGYQVGNFPVGWAEWNGRYRDDVRGYWKGEQGLVPTLASRLSGSADIYKWSQRSAYASVNFVVAHDGYTLHDLVSYERKHNEANGEGNRDGHDHNISRNWGVEGMTEDRCVLEMRHRSMRNFLATLAFSQGVPMLAHGDEIARTQRGNNNAYAQDNETSWVHWDLDTRRRALLEFTRRVFAIRNATPVLRRRTFFRGDVVSQDGIKDLTWLRPDAQEMTQDDWDDPTGHALAMLVHGHATDETDDRGRPIRGDTMLVLLNGSPETIEFAMPALADEGIGEWTVLVDTAEGEVAVIDAAALPVLPYSLVLLRHGQDRRLTIG